MSIFPHKNKMIHPMIMGFNLLLLTILSSININLLFNNHWLSFIIFLIMIGGLMILFLYFTSFISNMNSSIKWKKLINFPFKLFMLSTFFIMMIMNFNKFIWSNKFIEINNMISISKNILMENNIQMNFLFLINKNMNTLLMMMFLIISLTFIVKICINKKFSLRKIN
uniref:NADH dehydrogenase subunit 6 n=1 Tax=Anastatus shichengensis TaxID=3025492 RepID=UPI0023AA4D91|nr:NADH dehydrogenase subunit 6 [Anastatus shichengensis]WCO11509.1 NADH dehydrogenase subunit 6 [Anastatus shichengensis]